MADGMIASISPRVVVAYCFDGKMQKKRALFMVGVDLLGAVAVGAGAAALIYALMHSLRKAGFSPARWLLPAGIGLSMIGYSVWNDYTWLAREQARLPEGSTVLLVGYDSQFWAPWTYLAPVAVRFAALDPSTTGDTDEGWRRADIMLTERRGPTVIVPQEYDCDGNRFRQSGGEWIPATHDNPAFTAICSGDGG